MLYADKYSLIENVKTKDVNKDLSGKKNKIYQSPLILTELIQHNLINVSYLTACYLYQVMMTLHFLNDVVNDTPKSKITSQSLV